VLIHLALPIAALIVAGFDRKLVLLFCPLAIIPDLDIIFGAHRSISHSLFALGGISIVLILYALYFKPQWKNPAIIISLLILSHPFMDIFVGPTQFLWPIDSYYYLLIEAPIITLSPLTIDFSAFSMQFLIYTPQEAGEIMITPFSIFTNEGLIALIIIGVAVLYWIIRIRKAPPEKIQK